MKRQRRTRVPAAAYAAVAWSPPSLPFALALALVLFLVAVMVAALAFSPVAC